jgi:hypothetical protein
MKNCKLYTDNFNSISIDNVIRTATETGQKPSTVLAWITDKDIQLTSTRLTFGNRNWFVCPDCRGRVGKLYQTINGLTCRHCLGLKYRDREQHRNKYFETFIRPLKKTKRIEDKLNKKLRYTTREKLLNRYSSIMTENKLN